MLIRQYLAAATGAILRQYVTRVTGPGDVSTIGTSGRKFHSGVIGDFAVVGYGDFA